MTTSTAVNRRRRTILVLAATTVILVGSAWWLFGPPAEDTGSNTRTAQAGEVEVTMTAQTLNGSGAVFELALDTHAESLDLDLTSAAELRINGASGGTATWTGNGPGGHHREGTLRFATPVPSGASVELRIIRLPGEAVGTWTAP